MTLSNLFEELILPNLDLLQVWSLLLVLLAPSVALATLPGEYLGEFEFPMHLVKGSLFSLSDKTLFIHRFYYDGQGPPGVIFVAVPQGENDYGKV